MYNPYQQGYNPQQGYNQGYQQFQSQQQGAYQPQLQPQSTGYYPQPNQFQQPQLQTQSTGFQSQPSFQSGQSQPGFQSQPTRFQSQSGGFQSQQTGFQQQGFQSQPGAFQPQATGFQQQGFQPQATGFQPQATGFQSSGYSNELKIPSIRLSFITAADQAKFEDLFRTAVSSGEQALSGDSARDILLRSGLQPVTLAEIWSLSDTNKSGSLLFPEFALSLHLCNLALKGEPLPGVLPDKWMNEVKSFVDAISFSVPEDPAKILANTPFANAPSTSFQPQQTGIQPPTSFQPQATGFNAPLTAQRTGGGTLIPLQPQQTAGLIPAQRTGPSQPLQQQTTGNRPGSFPIAPQRTGPLQTQGTGYQPSTSFVPQATGPQNSFQPATAPQTSFVPQATGSFQPQQTGFQGFQPQPTGSFESTKLQPQQTGYLQSLPTGKPGQWGFVSTPTGGLPGLSAMEQHFLPSSSTTNNIQNVMGGNLKQNVTWAITKQEKQIYDGIFNAWDTSKRGYVDGDVAIGIFGKSGLGRPDLESIWTLADGSNRGKLNKDEFAVAMHLVYRRLNGYDLPLRLPPELVPPSTKHIQDSFNSLKESIRGKNVSRTSTSNNLKTTDGSRFKNDDDSIGYVASTRYKSRNQGDAPNTSGVKTSKDTNVSVEELKKLVREKKILLDAMDTSDQDNSIARTGSKDNEQIASLKRKIQDIQEKLITGGTNGSLDEKKSLTSKLNHLTKDVVPGLISRIYQVNEEIGKSKIEVFKLKLLKANPDWKPSNGEADIVGTGPNGEITDIDRKKFRSKQLLKQRMAALTGKSYGGNEDLDNQLNQAIENTNKEKQNQSDIINDISNSIKELEDGCIGRLQVSNKEEVGISKWENGEGVNAEVSKFIKELNVKKAPVSPPQTSSKPATSSKVQSSSSESISRDSSKGDEYKPEDRAAYIKAQAEKRMNERLAKLGIRRRGADSSSDQNVSKVEPKAVEPQVAPRAPEPEVKAVEPAPLVPQIKPSDTVKVDEDDDDDKEYQALMKQKQDMEFREKERKDKKRKEKEERLAKLKKEMEQMKQKENDGWSSDEEPVTSVPTYGPGQVKKEAVSEVKPEVKTAEAKAPEVNTSEAKTAETKPHDNNPFAKIGQTGQTPTGQNTNPFFKPTATPPIDPNKAAAQRKSQRGLGDDDDWSDSDNNESEEEDTNRAGAAHLASLLFGGMSQPPQRANTDENSKEVSTVVPPVAPAVPSVVPPVPPVAPQVPKIPSQTPPQAPPIPTQAPPPPIPSQTPPKELTDSSDDEFDFTDAPQEPEPIPPIPIPNSIPPPPPPSGVPPIPNGIPPPPPSGVLPIPNGAPPPPPPPSAPQMPTGIPPPPPMAPQGIPPPPPMANGSNGSAPAAPPAAGLSALLGQIRGGAALKKVDSSEQRIADSPVVGRVV